MHSLGARKGGGGGVGGVSRQGVHGWCHGGVTVRQESWQRTANMNEVVKRPRGSLLDQVGQRLRILPPKVPKPSQPEGRCLAELRARGREVVHCGAAPHGVVGECPRGEAAHCGPRQVIGAPAISEGPGRAIGGLREPARGGAPLHRGVADGRGVAPPPLHKHHGGVRGQGEVHVARLWRGLRKGAGQEGQQDRGVHHGIYG